MRRGVWMRKGMVGVSECGWMDEREQGRRVCVDEREREREGERVDVARHDSGSGV